MSIIHDAIYTAAEDKDHAGNPLIEALPPPREHKQWLELLMQRPAYSENDRLGSESVRILRQPWKARSSITSTDSGSVTAGI